MNIFSLPKAWAAGEIGDYTPPGGLPSATTDIGTLLSKATDSALPLIGALAALLLIISGIQYALAAGDEEKEARAKRTIKWTLFGLVLALAAYGIVYLVTEIFG